VLKSVCRIVSLVWAAGAVIGGLTTGQYGAAAVGAVVICALL